MENKSELAFYYQKKILLLQELLRHLKEEENLLSYGDADNAVKIEFKNEPILLKLKNLDLTASTFESGLPFTEGEIALSEKVFQLLDEARIVQSKVQQYLELEMSSAKKEMWEFRIKRKLKHHFLQSSGLSWTKNYC